MFVSTPEGQSLPLDCPHPYTLTKKNILCILYIDITLDK